MKPGRMLSPIALAGALFLGLSSCGGGGNSSGGGGGPTPTPTPPPAAGADIAITNVRVLPMDGSGPSDGMTVRIKDGLILQVAATASTPADATTVIDGSGKVLMPGLIDAHVHVYDDYEMPLFPANGVTTVRNMWGTPQLLTLRQRIRSGSLLGPEIVTSGPIIDGNPPFWATSDVATSPAEGRALVRAHKAAGYDFIKVYFGLDANTFAAIADEAGQQGLRYAGHAPRAFGVEEVYGSDIWSVEHLDGYLSAIVTPSSGYVPGSSSIEDLFAILRDIRDGLRPASDLYSPGERARLAQVSLAADTAHVPTLSFWQQRYLTRAEVTAQKAQPEMRFIHPSVRAEWAAAADAFFARYTDEQLELFDLQHDEDYRILADLFAAGVEIPTGTDARNPYVLFGFSMHEELEHYVTAGLSEMDALRWATSGAAQFLGLEGRIGRVVSGLEADLILLDADPSVDIANSTRIAAVLVDGRRYSRAQLDAALENVANGF